MIASFRPSRPAGTIQAPPSKSMAHRLLICAGLSKGESLVRNVALSDDILATLDCLQALGVSCHAADGSVSLRGQGPDLLRPRSALDCRECGSTLRFFIPICLLNDSLCTLRGSRTLFSRPLSVYQDICARQGLAFSLSETSVSVRGRLSGGEFILPGDISSQFVSGLLFVLPLLAADSRLILLPPVESRSYINMTMQALSSCGVETAWADDQTLLIPGGQSYLPVRAQVEGDHSNAAFFDALNLLGGQVLVSGLDAQSRQGDRVYKECFERLRLGPAHIDMADCPDLGPILLALAAALHGGAFTGTRRLRLKESDRGVAMGEELHKFGAELEIGENSITVSAGLLHPPSEILCGHNDHRVVMALSVLCSRFGGRIAGAEAVRKSLPDFFDRLRALQVEVTTDGMDQ